MASIVPLKEKRLLDVKVGELPSWIPMRDFSPTGIAGAFQRSYYRDYNKYINVKKGSIVGLNMVLTAYVLFNYWNSNMSGDASTTEKGPAWRALCTLAWDCLVQLPSVNSLIMARFVHSLSEN